MAHDAVNAKQEILQRNPFLHPVRRAVHRMLAVAGKIQHRLAHSLAGNRSGVDADAADDRIALDHDYPLAQLGRLNGSPMASRAGTNYRQVVFVVWHDASGHESPIAHTRAS